MIPEREATPNVAFGPSNPIPQELVDALFSPLAYAITPTSQSALPNLNPRQSAAFENGAAVQVELVITNNENGYLLRGDNWQVSLEATDTQGTPMVLDDSGNIVLNSDRFVQFQGAGFAPGSIIKVWLFSDPTSISDLIADASGNFSGSAQLPANITNGEHTVQLNGLSKDGQIRSVALGVVVQPDVVAAPVLPPFDFTPLWNLVFITAGVVMMFLLVLLARKRWFLIAAKRRKRKEEERGNFFTSSVSAASPTQQFPNDSRRRIGAGAPPNRKRTTFKPKDA